MPEVEIMETRGETRAESPAHSIHNVDTDSESTAEAIRREFGDDFPGLPWTPNTGFSNISVRQCDGTFADAKYVRFAIEGEEPCIYGCNGIGAPEYRQKLYTSACYNQFPHNPEECIDAFLDDSFFQCASLRGAELLGDMGILAEIYRLNRYDRERRALKLKKREWEKRERELTEQYQQIREEEDCAEEQKKLAAQRLARAKVNARIYERLTHASREAAALSTAEGPAWLEAFTRSTGTPAPSNPTPVLAKEEPIRVALTLNANLQRSLTPGVSSWDGYPRTWPHINFIARENNIPIYQARERFANYDVASLYEAWRTPIPPAPRMPDPHEDRSRPRQSSHPTVHRLVATTNLRCPPAASTSTAGSSISTMDLDPDEDDYGYDVYEDYNWEA
ncbi:hypothetical protein BC827DRAFT_1272251 [Russula dissimulans]|nr:hypothetical protein BC827DRAFT_1272251 [Russula dissimulans]